MTDVGALEAGGRASARERAWRARVAQPRTPAPPYAGPYVAVPTVGGTVLPTAGRTMARDVEVPGIPRLDADNGTGTTVTIGG